MKRTPDSLLSRLLGAEDRAPEEAGDPRIAAELAAAATDHAQGDVELHLAMMAAYLDGELADGDRIEADAVLVASPAAFEEMASAAAFVDAVSEKRMPAPRELLAQAVVKQEMTRTSQRSKWGWAWAAAAVAAAVAVVLAGLQVIGTADPKAPLMATPQPTEDPAQLSEPERKGLQTPTMVPAGSVEVAPSAPTHQKPRLAPEGMDAVPTPRSDRQ